MEHIVAERLEDLRMEFTCVKCGRQIVVPVRWMGRLVRCSHCQTANRVGRTDEPVAGNDELRLPARVSHARYLDEAEQKMAAAGAKNRPRLKWSGWVWGLIALNAAVAMGAAVLIVMKMMQ